MRLALVFALLFGALTGASAAGMDDQYLEVYNLIQEADGMAASQAREAAAKYSQAQLLLERMQKGSPEWNPTVVNFRLKYLAQRLSELAAGGVRPAPMAEAIPGNLPPTAVEPTAQNLASTAAAQAEAEALRGKVHDLETDKALLESKLREALAAVPAPMDPAELTRVTSKVKELQKENELLKTRIEQDQQRKSAVPGVAARDQMRKALDEANRKLAEETERAQALEQTNRLLQARYDTASKTPGESLELAALRSALETANQQLAQQRQSAGRAALDQTEVRTRLDQLQAAADRSTALTAENELLKKQLEEVRRQPAAAGSNEDLTRQLAQARAQIALLQSDQEMLRAQRGVNNPGTNVLAPAAVSSATPKQAARLRQLERERDEFEQQLKAAKKELNSRKEVASAARMAQLEKDLESYRARVTTLEARVVPFTVEELALFSKPTPTLTGGTTKSAAAPTSPTVTKLVSEAQRQAAAGQIDQAATTLQQAAREPGTNISALSALAATQVAQNHLEEAEKILAQALAASPNDAASLSLLGALKHRQGKFDEAVEILSRAAIADPKNAEVQNYLGLSLSQKGLRAPAETALRKAIQLQPNYASAHYNLAVVYLSQQPPMIELARWHYQKALATGQTPSPDFEKTLESRASGK